MPRIPLRRDSFRNRWSGLLAGVLTLFATGGCATSGHDFMESWVTSLEWFHPEYEGSSERFEQLKRAWQQEKGHEQH